MNYDEYYNQIINLFEEKIKTKDHELHDKIFDCLNNWYKSVYEDKIKFYFEDLNELAIINATKEIIKICESNDFDKIQSTYNCRELNNLDEISSQIFDLVKKTSRNEIINFNQSDYDNYINKLKEIESSFPLIIIAQFNKIKSECLLDLNYILKRGKVNNYSFRTYDYLRK